MKNIHLEEYELSVKTEAEDLEEPQEYPKLFTTTFTHLAFRESAAGMLRYGKIDCSASSLLNVQRNIGEAVDFTDRYMKKKKKKNVEEKKKKKKKKKKIVRHDSNIS